MPHRSNRKGDLGNYRPESSAADIDNIFFTEEGWVYRHFKGNPSLPGTRFWDEIIVAGQVDTDDANNQDVLETINATPRQYLGLGSESQSNSVDGYNADGIGFGSDEINWETVVNPDPNSRIIGYTDGCKDIEYSMGTCYDSSNPPPSGPVLGTVVLIDEGTGPTIINVTRKYRADLQNNASDRNQITGELSISPGVENTDWIIDDKDRVEYLIPGVYTLTVVVTTTEDVTGPNTATDTLSVSVEAPPTTTLGSSTITPKSSIIDDGESITFSHNHVGYTVDASTISEKLIVEGGSDYKINGNKVTFGVGTNAAESYTVKYEISSSDPNVDFTPIYTDIATVSVSEIAKTTMVPVTVEPVTPPADATFNVGETHQFKYSMGGDADPSQVSAVCSADNGASVSGDDVTFNNSGPTIITYTLTSTEDICEPKVSVGTFEVDAIPVGSTDKPWEDEDGVVVVHFFAPTDTLKYNTGGGGVGQTIFETAYQLDGSGNFVTQLDPEVFNEPIPNGEYVITIGPKVNTILDPASIGDDSNRASLGDMTDFKEATELNTFFNGFTGELKGDFNLVKCEKFWNTFGDRAGNYLTGWGNFATPVAKEINNFLSNSTDYNMPLPSGFDTSNVTNFTRCFHNCTNFNQPLSLNLEKVQFVSRMFEGATSFNQPLDNVTFGGEIKNLEYMFSGATSFNNTGLGYLDLSNVRGRSDISQLFRLCPFNQDITTWCIPFLQVDDFAKDTQISDENLPCSGACPIGNFYGQNVIECISWTPEKEKLPDETIRILGGNYDYSNYVHVEITTDSNGNGIPWNYSFWDGNRTDVYMINENGEPIDQFGNVTTSEFQAKFYVTQNQWWPNYKEPNTTYHYIMKTNDAFNGNQGMFEATNCDRAGRVTIGKFTRINASTFDATNMFKGFVDLKGLRIGGSWSSEGGKVITKDMFRDCKADILIANDWHLKNNYDENDMDSMFRNAYHRDKLDLSGWCVPSDPPNNFGITGDKAPKFNCHE